MRFTVLDSWRGLCALWVAIYHLRVVSHINDVQLFRYGGLGVEFFFVLSGFVLTCAYGERMAGARDRIAFMIRRFGRLYPLHLATLAIVVAMEVARWLLSMRLHRDVGGPLFAGQTDLTALPANLLLAHGWGFTREFTWNVPSWSISVEFLLCALFVVAFALPRRLISLALLSVAGLALFIYTHYGVADEAESTTAVARGIYDFFLGALVFHVYRWWTTKGRGVAPWLEWLIIPALLLSPATYLTPFAPLIFAPMIFIFAFEKGPISRLLNRPLALRVGEVSYSIYLIHYPIVLAAFGVASMLGLTVDLGAPWIQVHSRWVGDVIILAYVVLVIGVAMVTFRLIEEPGRAFFNRQASRFKNAGRGPVLAEPAPERPG